MVYTVYGLLGVYRRQDCNITCFFLLVVDVRKLLSCSLTHYCDSSFVPLM